jgi:hypothetical protein
MHGNAQSNGVHVCVPPCLSGRCVGPSGQRCVAEQSSPVSLATRTLYGCLLGTSHVRPLAKQQSLATLLKRAEMSESRGLSKGGVPDGWSAFRSGSLSSSMGSPSWQHQLFLAHPRAFVFFLCHCEEDIAFQLTKSRGVLFFVGMQFCTCTNAPSITTQPKRRSIGHC